jgi:hypothetical protein
LTTCDTTLRGSCGRPGTKGLPWKLHKLAKPGTVTELADAAASSSVGRRPNPSAYRRSETVMEVVRRAYRYFLLEEETAAVRVSYRRGQPPVGSSSSSYAAHGNPRYRGPPPS